MHTLKCLGVLIFHLHGGIITKSTGGWCLADHRVNGGKPIADLWVAGWFLRGWHAHPVTLDSCSTETMDSCTVESWQAGWSARGPMKDNQYGG